MDTTTAATTQPQWPPQEVVVVKPMEEIVKLSGSGERERERKIRSKETVKGAAVINCPRCNSTNTKFCYYNNYSLSQPRYFCKTCRRYWTEGGSLRNIPVGGGSRKNKRSSSSSTSPSLSSSSSLSSSKKLPDLVQNPKILDSHDLNLGFALHHQNHHDFKAITDMIHSLPSSSPPPHHLSPLELLTGLQAATSRGLSSFMPTSGDHSAIFSTSGFALPEFKPSSLNFVSLEGLGSGSGYGSFHGVEETNGKLLFPFEDLKQVSNSNGEQNRDQNNGGDDHNSNGYWNGVIGGGGSW